jgi:alpha-galactosidase
MLVDIPIKMTTRNHRHPSSPMFHSLPSSAILCIAALGSIAPLAAKPLKVFILAGQSNMEGPAHIRTFDAIGDDPSTAPLLEMMRGADGKPKTCENVRISYLTGANEENFTLHGKLTAGFGSLWGLDRTKPGDKIGPEFTFGLTMEQALDGPVLLIKAAWGGKSLHTDFRPPSAGPYELSSFQLENYPKQEGHGIPKDFEQWKIEKQQATGRYYRLMMDHVKLVLGDVRSVYPEYDLSQGFELSGFIWFQGFNDMVDSHVYPRHNQPDRYALYSDLLAHLIRDVRKDLNAPALPFVIGVMGVGGLGDTSPEMTAFRNAMAAPADMPEFAGNVAAVPTAPFWADELGAIDAKRGQVRQMEYFLNSNHKDHANAEGKMTDEEKRAYLAKFETDLITPAERALWERGASNAGYHYLGSAKTFALMGKAFAEANLKLIEARKR